MQPEESCCLLLRSIINRPALASHIKSLKLWGEDWIGDQESRLPWSGKFYTVWRRRERTVSFGTIGSSVDKSIFARDEYAALEAAVRSVLFPRLGYNISERAGERQWGDSLCSLAYAPAESEEPWNWYRLSDTHHLFSNCVRRKSQRFSPPSEASSSWESEIESRGLSRR